jgi:uncharacterized protein (TIGR00369 family)
MNKKDASIENLMEKTRAYWENMPFNLLLGVEIVNFDEKDFALKFKMKDELVGNHIQGDMLHGGVTASILDTVGGMLASISRVKMLMKNASEFDLQSFTRGGTIDLRVDYLRLAMGRVFGATGSVLRHGKKVVVATMAVNNDRDDLLAVGTGTYLIG